jgi:hypothetical protein
MMNCPRVAALVTEFFEGTMSQIERARFKFHIWWCKDCRVHVEKMEELVDALGTIPPDESVPEEIERLSSEFGKKE